MKRSLFLGLVAALAITGIASAGMFETFPTVGGAAKSCGSVNGVQNCTVPAGPSALTGNETIPADTNLSQGRNPQTVVVTPSMLGAGPTTYNVPLTTESVTIDKNTRRLIIVPAGTIAAFTLVFPAATTLTDRDNAVFSFCTTQIVTTLTTTAGAGTTVLNAPTAMLVPVATGAASCVGWVYRLSNTTWYRIQ